ncbi:MAG: hypothetical protein A2X94_04005 [Bdellovibrionales bacterium GWB1_55_8]|nr:MAG: hypothetical protein A2X94_04005 [Bdellovibrionales bacterium GWB1_55_8]
MARAALAHYLLFSVFFFASQAVAYEWLPEFGSLTEAEQSEFEGPGRFSSEYPADILSYLKPADWEYLWLLHPRALDLVIGSTGSAHFQIDQRVKIHAPLTDHLDFRFTYFESSDREKISEHTILELVFWPWKRFGISFYGEPEHFKRGNDTGIALLLRPSELHEIRLFNTFIDVTRLKRSDTPDNFVDPYLPYARGMVGRLWSDAGEGKTEFFEYAFRYETKTRWNFPLDFYDYEYWKWFGSLFGQKSVAKAVDMNFRLQMDRKFESREPYSEESDQLFASWRTDRIKALVRAEFREFGPEGRWQFTPGLEFSKRVWTMESGEVQYRDLIPHMTLRLPGFGAGDREDFWDVGFVANWHRVFRAGAMPGEDSSSDSDGLVEMKLNLSYGFNFGSSSKLILIATGDLNKFFTRRSWDGGSAQFQLFF